MNQHTLDRLNLVARCVCCGKLLPLNDECYIYTTHQGVKKPTCSLPCFRVVKADNAPLSPRHDQHAWNGS